MYKAIEYHTLVEEFGWFTTRSINLSPVGISRVISIIKNNPSLYEKYWPYWSGITSENSYSFFMSSPSSKIGSLINDPLFQQIASNTLIPPNLYNWYEKYYFGTSTPLNQYAIDTMISIISSVSDFSVFLKSLDGITPENCFDYQLKIRDIYQTIYICLKSLEQIIPDEENKK